MGLARTHLRRTLRHKLGYELGPFGSKDVCTCKRAVSTTDNEGINTLHDEIVSSS